MHPQSTTQVAIIGSGFAGLSAAYELSKQGIQVTLIEAEPEIGGLAAAFQIGEKKLDCFYHHWFTSDAEVMALIAELGLNDQVHIRPTRTGIYYEGQFFQLSTPKDLLNFTPLSFFDRLRLGFMALRARWIKNWHKLEGKKASQWLEELGGKAAYRVVWQPLLQGKFGCYAKDISAVWFWNKLKLRGGSRGKKGEERLAYFEGGFIALAKSLAARIQAAGGRIAVNTVALAIQPHQGRWLVETSKERIEADQVIVTTALPLFVDMVKTWAAPAYLASLRKIEYISNICLVLELDRSLSDFYWLNVNDPSFPFVGLIEHTNLEPAQSYGGRHIIYLSKYLPHTNPLYCMDGEEFLRYALPFLQKMFPTFEKSWVIGHHLWKARWSQPLVVCDYSRLLPSPDGPLPGLHLCSMAQIYPEDRGTNYAVRAGRQMGQRIGALLCPQEREK